MNETLFKSGIEKLNIVADDRQIRSFAEYSALLKEWNQKMNLTAITDDEGIAVKHFLDSILPLSCIELKEEATVADIGTGAGFPGIPIKIMRPDISLILLDSLKKRIGFLEEVGKTLGLEKTTYIHGRAEEFGKNPKYREKVDVVVSRAVANLKVLCEYCLPFVKVGGTFVSLKAEEIDQELEEARAMIGSLGGRVAEIKNIALPESDIIRKIVIIKKEKPTPPQFPRRPNKIK